MWGSWYGVLAVAVLAGLLLIVAALTAWTPLFAVGIAAIVIAGIAVFYAIKGGREETGSGVDDGLATPEDEPEHQPRRAAGAGGVWGEKRET